MAPYGNLSKHICVSCALCVLAKTANNNILGEKRYNKIQANSFLNISISRA